jgi:hypothetical protein
LLVLSTSMMMLQRLCFAAVVRWRSCVVNAHLGAHNSVLNLCPRPPQELSAVSSTVHHLQLHIDAEKREKEGVLQELEAAVQRAVQLDARVKVRTCEHANPRTSEQRRHRRSRRRHLLRLCARR